MCSDALNGVCDPPVGLSKQPLHRCTAIRIDLSGTVQALRARPRRRRLPPDLGERPATAIAVNVLDRSFEAAAPNRKWIADFTYV
jgi:putative transposase